MRHADFTEEPPLERDVHSRRRPGTRIDRLYALVTSDAEGEGIVRRNTPAGPQAFITDDREVAEELCAYVRAHHFPNARVVVFRR